MSRHRNMRHMIAEDDYDDYGDDDYYDDYDDYGGGGPVAAPKASKTSGSSKKKKKAAAAAAGAAGAGAAATTTVGAAAAKTTTTTQQQQKQQTPNKAAAAASSTSSQLEVVRPPSTSKTSSISSGGGLTVIAAGPSLSAARPPPGFAATMTTTVDGATSTSFHKETAPVVSNTTSAATTAASSTNAASTNSIPPILLQRQSRPSLTCVVLGHVDAGKSTLTGHLLWKAGTIRNKSSSTLSSTSIQQRNKPPINFAWLLDEDEEERKHGVTMDVATKMLATRNYNICLQDAPGHADYVPCMITGTANADAAIVVVDVTDRKTLQPLLLVPSGPLGKGAKSGNGGGESSGGGGSGGGSSSTFIGQLREHLVLAKGLGITQLIVVLNKMDVRHWDYELYVEVQQIVQDFLTRQLGFAAKKIQFLPASGLTGANIMEKPASPEMSSWHNKGNANAAAAAADAAFPTLFEALDRLELPGAAGKQQQGAAAGGGGGGLLAKPLRIVLTDVGVGGGGGDGSSSINVTNKRGVSVRGKVVAGWVRVGQSVTLLPAQDVATVQKLSRLVEYDGENDDSDDNKNNKSNERSLYGAAGEVVDMVLMGVDLARLAVGTLLVPATLLSSSSSPTTLLPMVSNHCRCKIYVLDAVPIPIIRGATASFHMHHLDVPCHVNKLIETLSTQADNNNSDKKKKRPPRALTARTTALVEITLLTAIAMETFSDCRPLGRFVLRRGGDSIAVGRIEQVLIPTGGGSS